MGEAVPKTGDVKFPIGVKLALIIGFIVLVSLGSVTIISTLIMGKDVKVTAENNNLSLNTRSASTVEDKLSSIKANVSQLLDLIGVVSGGRKSSNARQATTLFLERNPEIAAIYVLSENGIDRRNSSDDRIVNAQFFISNEIESTVINEFLSARKEDVVKSIHGETIALNLSPFFGLPVMGLLFPWKENGRDQTCIIIFSIESLSEILGTGSGNTTFMINNLDEIISHPDVEKVLAGTSYTNHELVKKIRESSFNNLESMQVPYKEKDENGKKTSYFGAALNGSYTRMDTEFDSYKIDGNLVTAHLDFVYQKVWNKKTVWKDPLEPEKQQIKFKHFANLEAHAGAGFTYFMDYVFHFEHDVESEHFDSTNISANVGGAYQLYFTKRFYTECNVDFVAAFTSGMSYGMIIPSISAGWQF